MARNIESGVKMTIIAKLREGGKTEQEATALADSNASAGIAFFNERAQVHSTESGGIEGSYDKAFEDLREWSTTIV